MHCGPWPPPGFNCENQILSDNFHSPETPRKDYPGQSGKSGRTKFHQKVESNKRPKGKFTSLKK